MASRTSARLRTIHRASITALLLALGALTGLDAAAADGIEIRNAPALEATGVAAQAPTLRWRFPSTPDRCCGNTKPTPARGWRGRAARGSGAALASGRARYS